MRGDRSREALEVVAAFEDRDDAAAATLLGDFHQLAGDPDEIRLDQIDVAERIAAMRVETGRDDDQVGRKVDDPRQDGDLDRLAKRVAGVAGPAAAR